MVAIKLPKARVRRLAHAVVDVLERVSGHPSFRTAEAAASFIRLGRVFRSWSGLAELVKVRSTVLRSR
jgi:hypothetical protein